MTRIFKKITALVMAAVTAGALGLDAAAEAVEKEEEIGGYTVEERANWGINDYAENIKTVYKLTYPDEADVIDGIVDAIVSSETFAGIFEEEGREAFLIVEDSLRNALEPSAAPLDEYDNCYYSKYYVNTITQSGAGKSAAAATLMALIGSGVSGYSANSLSNVQTELNEETSTNMTISQITKVLKKHIPARNGYTVKMMGCVPNKYNTAYQLINCISDALYRDTVPVIQIEDTSLLDYYNGTNIGPHYLAVTEVDTLAECIVVLDPNNDSKYNGSHNIDYADLDILLRKAKVIWVSGFVADKTCSGLEAVMAEYPAGTYFNNRPDGKACTCHGWCKPGKIYNDKGEYCTCIRIDDGTQCVAFARHVFYSVKGRAEKESESNSLYKHYVGETVKDDPVSAKDILSGVSIGTYVRVETTTWDYVNNCYIDHSLSIVDTSDTYITVYQANYGGRCLVTYKQYTWAEFVKNFQKIYFYVE